MNRRGFFRHLLLGGAAFTILPGAGRIWRARRQVPANFSWIETRHYTSCESDEYRQFIDAFMLGHRLPEGHPAAGGFANLPSITVETQPYLDHLQKLLGVEPAG